MKSFLSKIPLAIAFVYASTFSQELLTYKVNGAKDKRINIVIVGDGYTSSQKALFETHMEAVYDAIVSDPVLNRYNKYHNFYGIYRASNESGADNDGGCNTTTKDTYYESKYCTSNVDRLLTTNTSKVNTDVNALIPEADMIMVIVNSTRYGGSGGSIAVSSASSPEVIAHEIGHSFPKLKDEYESYYTITPQVGLNITNTTDRASIHWNYWIEASTPLPTAEISANNGIVGAFEGAAYQPTGWYRPENNCRMRSNGVDLCAVCAEIWALKIHELVSPVDEFIPLNTQVTDPDSLAVQLVGVSSGSAIDIQWFVDGTEDLTARGNTSWKPTLPPGDYEVWAQVRDTTEYVRQDNSNLLQDAQTWQVQISPASTTALTIHQEPNQTKVHADSYGLHWRAQGPTQYQLYQVNGELLADFETTTNSGMSAWPQRLNSGKYYLKISDDTGIHTKNFTIR